MFWWTGLMFVTHPLVTLEIIGFWWFGFPEVLKPTGGVSQASVIPANVVRFSCLLIYMFTCNIYIFFVFSTLKNRLHNGFFFLSMIDHSDQIRYSTENVICPIHFSEEETYLVEVGQPTGEFEKKKLPDPAAGGCSRVSFWWNTIQHRCCGGDSADWLIRPNKAKQSCHRGIQRLNLQTDQHPHTSIQNCCDHRNNWARNSCVSVWGSSAIVNSVVGAL